MPVGGEAPEAVIAFERIAAVAHETEQAAEDRRVDPAIGRCGANLGEQVRLAKGRGTGECHHMLREHVERAGAKAVGVALARLHGVQRSEEHTSELQSLMRISYA